MPEQRVKKAKKEPELALGVFLTKTQIARQFQVTEKSIDNYRALGLPSCKLGSRVLFHKEDVEAWLRNGGALNRRSFLKR